LMRKIADWCHLSALFFESPMLRTQELIADGAKMRVFGVQVV